MSTTAVKRGGEDGAFSQTERGLTPLSRWVHQRKVSTGVLGHSSPRGVRVFVSSSRASHVPQSRLIMHTNRPFLRPHTEWLRVGEKRGFFPPALRDRNGHRYYTEEDIERMRSRSSPAPSGVRAWVRRTTQPR